MPQLYRPAWQQYGAALFLVGVALALKLLLVPVISRDQPVLLFFAAVIMSAAFAGFGPGLLATGLSAICDSYFFMEPYGQLRLSSADQAFRLAIFVFEGVFVSVICARMNSARHLAESAFQRAESSANESRELQRRILEIGDAEQQRLGHDLHDGLGQHLTGIALLARRFQERLMLIAPAEADEAKMLSTLAQSAVEWTHDLCRTLSPAIRESADLPDMLQDLAAKAENIFSITCAFQRSGSIRSIGPAAAVHFYRIAQEAISNAVRHGRARKVMLRLEYSDDCVIMEIIDDGTGIELAAQSKEGMGLRIMRYRARVIGASIDIRPHVAGGTIVSCRCCSAANAETKAEYGND